MEDVHARFIRALEQSGDLDRERRGAARPTKSSRDRRAAGLGLTAPELAVLLAYAKIASKDDVLATACPTIPTSRRCCVEYFPPPCAIATRRRSPNTRCGGRSSSPRSSTAWSTGAGSTFAFRIAEETGATADEILRAHEAARAVFRQSELWHEIEALDGAVAVDTQTSMYLESRKMIERASRWFLRYRQRPLPVRATACEQLRPRRRSPRRRSCPSCCMRQRTRVVRRREARLEGPRRAPRPRGARRRARRAAHRARHRRSRRARRVARSTTSPRCSASSATASRSTGCATVPSSSRATTGGRRSPGARCWRTSTPNTAASPARSVTTTDPGFDPDARVRGLGQKATKRRIERVLAAPRRHPRARRLRPRHPLGRAPRDSAPSPDRRFAKKSGVEGRPRTPSPSPCRRRRTCWRRRCRRRAGRARTSS